MQVGGGQQCVACGAGWSSTPPVRQLLLAHRRLRHQSRPALRGWAGCRRRRGLQVRAGTRHVSNMAWHANCISIVCGSQVHCAWGVVKLLAGLPAIDEVLGERQQRRRRAVPPPPPPHPQRSCRATPAIASPVSFMNVALPCLQNSGCQREPGCPRAPRCSWPHTRLGRCKC